MPVWVKRIRVRERESIVLLLFDIRKAEREITEMPRGKHNQWESDKLIKDQVRRVKWTKLLFHVSVYD